MTLENLVGKGLKSEPPVSEEILRLLNNAATRIQDAHSEAISTGSRFDLAYEGILQLALCALRANGYRPDSKGGHHVLALQSLTKSIGYPEPGLFAIRSSRGASRACGYSVFATKRTGGVLACTVRMRDRAKRRRRGAWVRRSRSCGE